MTPHASRAMAVPWAVCENVNPVIGTPLITASVVQVYVQIDCVALNW